MCYFRYPFDKLRANVAKQKFYVVWQGREPGIFEKWDDCRRSVEGFPDPKYKSFETYDEAVKAFSNKSSAYIRKNKKPEEQSFKSAFTDHKPDMNAIAVDAACSGNPGMMEYRGVDLKTKDLLFQVLPLVCVILSEALGLMSERSDLGIENLTPKASSLGIWVMTISISWVYDRVQPFVH